MRALLAALLAAACVSPPAPLPVVAVSRTRVAIVFEPALAEPGVLVVDHECGLHVEVPTGRAGVDLELPPGPALLRLRVGPRSSERSIVVGSVACEVRWTYSP